MSFGGEDRGPFLGPYNKDGNILGSTLGLPYFGKLSHSSQVIADHYSLMIELRIGCGSCSIPRRQGALESNVYVLTFANP